MVAVLRPPSSIKEGYRTPISDLKRLVATYDGIYADVCNTDDAQRRRQGNQFSVYGCAPV